jgi:hypothetical protein
MYGRCIEVTRTSFAHNLLVLDLRLRWETVGEVMEWSVHFSLVSVRSEYRL